MAWCDVWQICQPSALPWANGWRKIRQTQPRGGFLGHGPADPTGREDTVGGGRAQEGPAGASQPHDRPGSSLCRSPAAWPLRGERQGAGDVPGNGGLPGWPSCLLQGTPWGIYRSSIPASLYLYFVFVYFGFLHPQGWDLGPVICWARALLLTPPDLFNI